MTRSTKEQIKAAADRAEARSRSTTTKEFVDTLLSEDEVNAEIKKLAALPVSVYESARAENAKRLNMRASVLDGLVKAKRGKPTKTDFLPHWNVEPWHEPVDGAALLTELRDHFGLYVVLPNKYGTVAIPLWVLLTWVFDSFDITPYLAITSPTRRCGKTVLMTLLNWLCCRAKKNDSMSKAAIYRSVESERPTLILDEVSWVLDLRDERQNILCGGFERLGHAEVCEGEGANITVKRYSTYCPKAFGLIGKLTATLMDRSIEIAMQRKLNEKVERLRRRDNDRHAELRRKCLRWANDNQEALKNSAPKEPAGLNDRAFDAWEPLLAVAERAGDDWLSLATEAAIALSGGEPAVEEQGTDLLGDIKKVFAEHGMEAITTKTFIRWLCVDEEKPWATYDKGRPITDRQLAKLLKRFEIISETVHPHETGEAKAKGYKRDRFTDAFDRYLSGANALSPQGEGAQACERASADEIGTSDTFCERAETEVHGCEKDKKPANDGGLHACTLANSNHGHEHGSGQGNGGNGFRSDIDDAYEELQLRDQAEDDGTIPPYLDRRPAVCAHCGQPGGAQWDYEGATPRLHPQCEQPWIAAYKASHRRSPGATLGSSL
jgi:putative DNA primase/helicase